MSLEDIAKTMFMKKAITGAGCYIFSPLMLIYGEGLIKELNCQWRIVVDKIMKRKLIEFNFINDASWAYRHDYKNYIALHTTNVVQYKDHQYFVQTIDHRLGVSFFRLAKNLASKIPRCTLTKIIHFPENEKPYNS